MTEPFAKLLSSIVLSSVWAEPDPIRLVWVTMLALADESGYVGASIPGLASTARVSVPDTELAIEKFLAPDPYSRNPEHDGRRIVPAIRGWRLLNYEAIRGTGDDEAVKVYERNRKRKQRSSRNASVPDTSGTVRDKSVKNVVCPEASASASASNSSEGKTEGEAVDGTIGGLSIAEVSWAWHSAAQCSGYTAVHSVVSWRREYATIAAGCSAAANAEKVGPSAVLWALVAWFWLAPDGAVGAGRVKRPKPSTLAKLVSDDIERAGEWSTTKAGIEAVKRCRSALSSIAGEGPELSP